jgi:hypothetical protein
MLLLNKCQATFPRPSQRMLKFTGCHSCFMELFGSDLKRKVYVGVYSRFLYVVNSKNSVQEETITQIFVLHNYCKLSVRAMNPWRNEVWRNNKSANGVGRDDTEFIKAVVTFSMSHVSRYTCKCNFTYDRNKSRAFPRCRSLIPNFTKFDQKIWQIRIYIHLRF